MCVIKLILQIIISKNQEVESIHRCNAINKLKHAHLTHLQVLCLSFPERITNIKEHKKKLSR